MSLRERSRSVTDAAIQRPIGTLSLASVIFVLGLFFFDRLPVDLLPNIEYSQIRVTVNYPGVAPAVMEQQVMRVLERNLASVENLVTIDSRASQGRTNVNLIFEYDTNLDLALQDAARYLELARHATAAGHRTAATVQVRRLAEPDLAPPDSAPACARIRRCATGSRMSSRCS